MSGLNYHSGKNRFVGQGIKVTISDHTPSNYEGAVVYSSDKHIYYSNGTHWTSSSLTSNASLYSNSSTHAIYANVALFSNNTTHFQGYTWNNPNVLGTSQYHNDAFFSNVVVYGDLNVAGNLVFNQTSTLVTNGAFIVVNSDQLSPLTDSGIIYQRYENANTTDWNVALSWDEATQSFNIGKTPDDGTGTNLNLSDTWLNITEDGTVTAKKFATTNANFTDIYVSGNASIRAVLANGSIGTLGQLLASNGSGLYWASEISQANNSNYLNNKAEADLNVNSATYSVYAQYVSGGAEFANTSNYANNATYLGGKSEGTLNVATASFAANTSRMNGRTEPNLNVNSAAYAGYALVAATIGGEAANAVFAKIANNAYFLNDKTETALNTNSAYYATTTVLINNKSENQLNVNSATYATFSSGVIGTVSNAAFATTANNSYYLGGKSEGTLNVATAQNATDSTYLGGKVEGALNVNSATYATYASSILGVVSNAVFASTANNALYLNGKIEDSLNVSTARNANNSTYLGGKSEGTLNVATASYAAVAGTLGSEAANAVFAKTANNSTYLGGKSEANLNVNAATYAVYALNGIGISKYTTNIGNGLNSSFTVSHNLNKTDVMVTVRDNSTGYTIYPDVRYTSSNTVAIEFSFIPTTNQYYAIVFGG